MGIMDFFRPAAPAQQPAQQQAPTAQPQGQQPQGQQPANPQQGNHSNTPTPNVPVNPLDAYSNMFNNANKPGTEVAPSFALDAKVVGDVSGSLDFTKDIPADLMSKALGGDAQALVQMMNHVGRGAYQTSLQHQSALTDKFVGARLDFEGKQLGGRVKSELTSSALANTPNYQHPVVRAELNRIASMLQKEHPDATPQAIAESAQKYLMDINSAMNPAKPASSTEGKEFDWAGYLSSN